MEIVIKQAILHVLDTNINSPVLSDCVLELDDTTLEFLRLHIMNAFASDNIKQCTFLENSHFCNELQKKNDFVNFTKLIATSFFNIMIRNVSIPNADLIIAEVSIDNILYLVMLKLNYKSSFIHHYSENNGLNNNTIIKQRTVLPATNNKVDEFFFINLSTLQIKMLEKKYELDGVKDFYISSLILECSQTLPEKVKFRTVKEMAKKALIEHYKDDKMLDGAISSLIVEETHDNILNINDLKNKIEEVYPLAKDTFISNIESENIEINDDIVLSPAITRKLEKQSIKMKNGVEIKIPIDALNDKSIEFINNPDGSISILIKNVYMQ